MQAKLLPVYKADDPVTNTEVTKSSKIVIPETGNDEVIVDLNCEIFNKSILIIQSYLAYDIWLSVEQVS